MIIDLTSILKNADEIKLGISIPAAKVIKAIIMLVIYLGLMFLFKLDFNEDIVKLLKNFFKRG